MLGRATAFLRAHHAWVVAAGLAGLAGYHLSRGEWGPTLSALVTAAGVLGLRFYPGPAAPPASQAPSPETRPHEDLSRK